MIGETEELAEEIQLLQNGLPMGSDGIIGETIDVILCALDIISKQYPEMTADDIKIIIDKKLNKWVKKYDM